MVRSSGRAAAPSSAAARPQWQKEGEKESVWKKGTDLDTLYLASSKICHPLDLGSMLQAETFEPTSTSDRSRPRAVFFLDTSTKQKSHDKKAMTKKPWQKSHDIMQGLKESPNVMAFLLGRGIKNSSFGHWGILWGFAWCTLSHGHPSPESKNEEKGRKKKKAERIEKRWGRKETKLSWD